MRSKGMHQAARLIAAFAGLYYVVFGAWAFAAPESFASSIATFPPYNEHYLHDLGAFQVGLGVTLLAAAAWAGDVAVVLLGAAVASILHAVSHVLDRDLGGRAIDPYAVGLIAVVVLLGAVLTTSRGDRRPRSR